MSPFCAKTDGPSRGPNSWAMPEQGNLATCQPYDSAIATGKSRSLQKHKRGERWEHDLSSASTPLVSPSPRAASRHPSAPAVPPAPGPRERVLLAVEPQLDSDGR